MIEILAEITDTVGHIS